MTSLGPADRGLFPPTDEATIVALACEMPSEHDLPFSHFTLIEFWRFVREKTGLHLSVSTVWRWLRQHALKPWSRRMWLFPRDPRFVEKATPVLELYAGFWQGEPLGPDDIVISADEKSGVQVLERRHATRPVSPGRAARIEHEYARHGTIAYLAALDVDTGQVIGRIDEKTGIDPFMRLVDQVMARRRCKKARRVFWIVDNGPSHHPNTFPERLQQRHPKAIAVHLPVHASWLNQIELYFSILQRKLLKYADMRNRAEAQDRVYRFEDRYNRAAQPFKWRFTVNDLKKVASSF